MINFRRFVRVLTFTVIMAGASIVGSSAAFAVLPLPEPPTGAVAPAPTLPASAPTPDHTLAWTLVGIAAFLVLVVCVVAMTRMVASTRRRHQAQTS